MILQTVFYLMQRFLASWTRVWMGQGKEPSSPWYTISHHVNHEKLQFDCHSRHLWLDNSSLPVRCLRPVILPNEKICEIIPFHVKSKEPLPKQKGDLFEDHFGRTAEQGDPSVIFSFYRVYCYLYVFIFGKLKIKCVRSSWKILKNLIGHFFLSIFT